MYRLPEKQTGIWTVSNCARCCFLSICKSSNLSLTFHQTEISWLFLPLFDLLRITLYYFVQAEFFHVNLRSQKEKTSRKLCVYNHGDSYLFRFTYTYANYPSSGGFPWRQKYRLAFPRCLPFGVPFLFWLWRFYKLWFRRFISTFLCGEVIRNAVTD